ncbi:MAG: transporter associated domain-containing protein [Candidatus Malihini olakiniferum]
MEFLLAPSIWAGLLTLVVLEIVLGIDNLVFIAILADKLPPKQRDKARVIGLSFALLMRLGLLSLISWIVKLTNPLITIADYSLSARDMILLAGGGFLLFKATTELHERLENRAHEHNEPKVHASFWAVVAQIVVLDAVFSLDAVITAVGMVNHIGVMMTAVVIAMVVMLLASKPLMNFIKAHPTVVMLCLSFLLMIGLSLVADGFGFHIPKGYLYAAIGFSILIELFNQIARRNFIKHQSRRPMRERTAEAILRLMGARKSTDDEEEKPASSPAMKTFAEEECYMISGVLTLASRSLRSVMTPRTEISWVDSERSIGEIRVQLLDTPHSLFPVCRGSLDELVGVVRAKELLVALESGVDVESFVAATPPLVVPDTLDAINLLPVLRRAKGSLVVVTNEFGVVQGLVTPLDLLEAIAGEFPDEDETPDIMVEEGGWLVKGGTDLHTLQQVFDSYELVDPKEGYASLAGLLLAHSNEIPKVGEVIELHHFRFEIKAVSEYRIQLVQVTRLADPYADKEE